MRSRETMRRTGPRNCKFQIANCEWQIGDQAAEAIISISQFVVERLAINQLKRLGEVAVLRARALAGKFPTRLAERLQVWMIAFAVGKLNRSCSQRNVREPFRGFRHGAQ